MKKKLQSITGMNDILPNQIQYWQKLESTAKKIMANYGFAEIRTPILEETQLFSRGIGDGSQVVQKEMYSFDDKGGDSVTMRPEGTAGVMRSYLQHSLSASDAITKLYYMGPMYRYERPQKGRYRQFHQIGAETIGIDSALADAEVVIMLDRIFKAVGVKEFELEINSLGTLEERKPYLEKLQEYFTPFKKELCEDCQIRFVKNPLRILDCKNKFCKDKSVDAPTMLDVLTDETREEFETFKTALTKANVPFKINAKIVRGLDYYEKTAFEFISSELGSQSTFCGGGRYNRLAQELGAKNPVPAVGFSIGCERTILIMQALESKTAQEPKLNGLYLAGMDQAGYEVCQNIMQTLRDAGIKAEMDYTVKSLKSQLRRGNKLGFKYVAISGENERAKSVVMLKDFSNGEQEEVKVDNLLGYLQENL
ncbi:histidine--tRNA ligase [bacterium K02(2017)]|nr:histidine--tRNA ligase [bacterium K02(2017)]